MHTWRYLTAAVLLAACVPSVPPSNPYDKDAPLAQQARATLSGVVYDYLGQPLRSAVVKLDGPTVPVNSPLTTDESGVFNFGELIPGSYTLDVKHPNHLRQIRDLLLAAGDARTLEINLEAVPSVLTGDSGHLTGVVQKAGELALAAAAQDHSGIVVEVIGVGTRTTTNSAGRFDIYLAPGTYSLGLSASSYKSETVANLVVVNGATTEASAAPIVLLANPGSVSGTVTLEGAAVLGNSGISVSLDNTASTATTDDSGTFVIDGVAAGTYTLRAAKSGFDTQTASGVSVRGGVQSPVSTLSLAISRGKLAGTVTLQGAVGGDNSGAVVSIASTAYSAVSTSSGSFEIVGIPAGSYTVTVAKEYYAAQVLANQAVLANVTSTTSPATITLVRSQGSFALEGGAAYSNLTGTAKGAVTKRRARISLLLAPAGSTIMKLTGAEVHSWKVGSTYYDPDQYTAAAGDGIPAVSSGSSSTWLDVFFVGDVSVSADDGTKTVSVTFSDGTSDTGTFFTSVIADVTAPEVNSASLLLDGGALYTGDDLVSASLAASDATTGVSSYRLWNGAAGAEPGTAPATIVAAVTHDLDPGSATPPDGDYSVSVRFFDAAGNASSVTTKTIRLDQVAPSGTASISCPSGGPSPQSGYCWTGSVTVDLAAFTDAAPSSGLALVQVINGTSFAYDNFVAFQTSTAHTLAAGDGSKEISVKVKDGALNTRTLTSAASIIVDSLAAQNIVVTLTGVDKTGASSVLSRDPCVSVAINATEANPYQVRVANTSDFSAATAYSVASFPITPTFTGSELGSCSSGLFKIPVGAGSDQSRAVYVELTDKGGNKAVGFGTIQIDRQAPLLTSAAFSANFTTSTAATLLVSASGASGVNVVGIGTSALSSPLGYQTYSVVSVPVTFNDATSGPRAVTVSVRDDAGNETTATADATIVLDSSPPSVPTVTSVNGKVADSTCSTADANDFHRTQVPLIKFSSSDVQSQVTLYRISENALFSDASWQAYPGPAVPVPFTLSSGDGNKTIYLETQNGAGVSSATAATICIILDTVAPGSLSLTPTGNDALGYSADDTVVFALDGYDDGVAGTSGLKYFVDAANSLCAAATAPTAWAATHTQVFSTTGGCAGDGTRRLALRAIDPADNVSDPFYYTIIKDSSAPTRPSIAYVKSLNRALEVSWSAASNNLQKYVLHYANADAMSPDSGTVDVGATETHTIITGPNNNGAGLHNFYDYSVWIEAVDLANQHSVSSPPVAGDSDFGQASVGWSLKNVASTATTTIVPQSVTYRHGTIYLLYNEASTAVEDIGGGTVRTVPQAITRLAISADGGDSWRLSLVADGTNTNPTAGRVNAALSMTRDGLSVITVRRIPLSTWELVEYTSQDDGETWNVPRVIDTLGTPFGSPGFGAAHPFPFAVAGTGGSRVVVFARRVVPGVDETVSTYVSTKSDSDSATPWSTVKLLSSDAVDRFSACNANLIDRVAWDKSGSAVIMAARSSFHGKDWNVTVEALSDAALAQNPALGGSETFVSANFACAPLGKLVWSYLFAVTSDGEVYVKARTDDLALSAADPTAPSGFNRISVGAAVVQADQASPVGAWAGQSTIFAAFRQLGTASLGVLIGSHDLSGGLPLTLRWRQNIVDDNHDGGMNAVVDGYNDSSPVIAYTDAAGHELKLARAANLVPQASPVLLDGSVGYSWTPSPNATAYEVTTQAQCLGLSQTFGTTNTQYSAGSADQCIEAVSRDSNALMSESGEQWRLSAFTTDVAITSGFVFEYATSDQLGLVASGAAVALLGADGEVHYSSDYGATFSIFDVPGTGYTAPRAMAQSESATAVYVHVVVRTVSLGDPNFSALTYVRGTYTKASGTWSWAAPIDLHSETQVTHEIANTDVAMKASGARVTVFYTYFDGTNKSVHVLDSSNHGGSFTGPIPAAPGPPSSMTQLDVAHLGGEVALFVRELNLPGPPELKYSRLNGGTLDAWARICQPDTAPGGVSDYCGTDVSRFVAASSNQFLVVQAIDAPSALPPAVRMATGSRNFPQLAAGVRSDAWRMGELDASFDTVRPDSIDLAASEGGPGVDGGFWLVHSSCTSSVVGSRWSLDLKYCDRSCQAAESWNTHVLKSVFFPGTTTCQVVNAPFNGLRIAVDAALSKLYVLYTRGDGGGPLATQHLLRGGYIGRKR